MTTKILYSLILTFIVSNINAQVGVNTDTPNTNVTLDVNGKTNVVQRVYLGGTNTIDGSNGTNGQVIISGGATNKPTWNNKRIPDGFGETFSMNYMNSDFDVIGADLGSNGAIEYTAGNTLNDTGTNCTTAGTCWKVLTELNHIFPVFKNTNKVNFVFQTVAQTNQTQTSSYACGVFLNSTSADSANPPLSDFKLVGVRSDAILNGDIGDYKLFNMNVTLVNLEGSPAGKNHAVRVACRGRTQGANIIIGKSFGLYGLLNPDLARSSLNIFVLESATGN